jgi:hypothetical protein
VILDRTEVGELSLQIVITGLDAELKSKKYVIFKGLEQTLVQLIDPMMKTMLKLYQHIYLSASQITLVCLIQVLQTCIYTVSAVIPRSEHHLCC